MSVSCGRLVCDCARTGLASGELDGVRGRLRWVRMADCLFLSTPPLNNIPRFLNPQDTSSDAPPGSPQLPPLATPTPTSPSASQHAQPSSVITLSTSLFSLLFLRTPSDPPPRLYLRGGHGHRPPPRKFKDDETLPTALWFLAGARGPAPKAGAVRRRRAVVAAREAERKERKEKGGKDRRKGKEKRGWWRRVWRGKKGKGGEKEGGKGEGEVAENGAAKDDGPKEGEEPAAVPAAEPAAGPAAEADTNAATEAEAAPA